MVSCIRWGVALGKILPQGVGGESHFVEITFLFLTHDDAHHIEGQMSLLAVFLEPLAWEREGVACSLSIASSKSRCSSFLRKDSS